MNFQSFSIISSTITFGTLYIYICQKLHGNSCITITSTGLTTTATFYIEAKFAGIVIVHSGFWQICKQIPDQSKYASICSWTRSRSAANWRLINSNNFIYIIYTLYFFMSRRLFFGAIKMLRQSFAQNIYNQG